jgi:hypothetical protein
VLVAEAPLDDASDHDLAVVLVFAEDAVLGARPLLLEQARDLLARQRAVGSVFVEVDDALLVSSISRYLVITLYWY